jgi:hypothetical protein
LGFAVKQFLGGLYSCLFAVEIILGVLICDVRLVHPHMGIMLRPIVPGLMVGGGLLAELVAGSGFF